MERAPGAAVSANTPDLSREGWVAGDPPRRRRRQLLSPKAWAYAPRLAQLIITRRCNLECSYCNEYDKTSAPVAPDIVKSWIDKIADFGCLFCCFLGGEPLLHPNLIELVGYATKARFIERMVITNGYLLSPDVIEGFNDAGLTHLQLSVDGVTPNQQTVKTLKPLRRKIEHLEKHARFIVRLNAVLGAGNDEEVLEVLRTARDMGFRSRVLVIHDDSGQMCIDDRGRELLAQVQGHMGRRWKEAGDYRTKLMRDGRADFKCRAGARYLYIDEEGNVNWCSQQRGQFSKSLLDYTWADLKEQFYTRKDCAAGCTVGCARTASRFDEWRRQGHVQASS